MLGQKVSLLAAMRGGLRLLSIRSLRVHKWTTEHAMFLLFRYESLNGPSIDRIDSLWSDLDHPALAIVGDMGSSGPMEGFAFLFPVLSPPPSFHCE